MRILIAMLACLLVASCARPVTETPSASYSSMKAEIRKETGDILDKYVAAQRRLLTIGGPILMHNTPMCPRRAFSAGFVVHSDFDLPKPLREVAYERMLLGSDAVVLAVFPGSEAWHEGVRPGDILVTMDGKKLRNAAEARSRLFKKKNPDPVNFGFIRQGRAFSATLPFTPICNYKIVYQEADRIINAWADGKRIVFTQGMMDFSNDRELAVVMGHELAHNIMHHIPKQELNWLAIVPPAFIIDGITGVFGVDTDVTEFTYNLYTEIWSPRFEKEADYVGLYLLARAGGDMTAAAPFWRKMAAEHGMEQVKLSDKYTRTHPDSPERFVVLEQTRKEIEDKIRRKEDLKPNLARAWEFGKKYWFWESEYEDEPSDDDLNH